MRNSEFILRTLDACLKTQLQIPLHLLGGAALDLVYGIERFSEDVDCMCTMTEAEVIDSDEFQNALAETNEKLEPEGFYLTHIFDENGLVHLPDWADRLVKPPADAPAAENEAFILFMQACLENDELRKRVLAILRLDSLNRTSLLNTCFSSPELRRTVSGIDAVVQHLKDDRLAQRAITVLTANGKDEEGGFLRWLFG